MNETMNEWNIKNQTDFIMNETDSASYMDDNRPFVACDSIDNVIKTLKNDSIKLSKTFWNLILV